MSEALNIDRMIYTPGVKKGKEAFAQVKDKDIYVILIDPKEKVVQYEVRTKLPEDGVQIQKRLLHSYFKYPLAMFLSKWNVLDATTFDGTYMQANRINIDSQSSIMLVAGKKKYSLAELSAGVIAAIVLGGLFVIVGMIVVSIQAKRASIANGSTVVDISIPPPFFKPVSLSLSRISFYFKTPKQVFF